jgi:mannose-1-phosphate guanylyltransferase
MNVCDVFLFAAGLGTRLRPFTEKSPKPVLPLLSYPLGLYPLPYVEQIPIQNFIVNTFHLPHQVHQLYEATQFKPKFSDEFEFIKGSAGGLKQAESLFSPGSTILAVNADEVLFTKDFNFLKTAFDEHTKNKNLATLVVKEHPGVGQEFGGIWCEGQTVRSISKKAPENSQLNGWHFIGYQFLSADVLKFIEKNKELNIFYDVLVHQLPTNRVKIFPIQADWYETGNLSDYKKAKLAIKEKLLTHPEYQDFYSKMNNYPKSELPDLE